MLRTILILAICSLLSSVLRAQTKIGDNTLVIDSASILELESSSKGFLPSRLTTLQRDAQSAWDEGHIIYNTTDNCLQIYNGSSWECFAQGVIIDSTIYKYNGTLTSNRTISMDGKQLTFDGSGDVVITDAGFVGIGDPTPEAKLDVEGGTVKLSDYGTGTNSGSESYLLGVDSDGDVIEISPAIDTFFITNDSLKLSLQSDRTAFKFVDLASYAENIYNTSDTLDANRVVTLDGKSLTFDGSTTRDVIIEPDADIGIGTTTPNAELQIHGDNTESAILLTTPLTGSGISDGLYLGVTDADQVAWIWNYENSDLSFGVNDDTKMTLKPTGQAQLLAYGSDTFLDNIPARLLAVQADGDIVETNMSLVGTDDQILDSLGLTGTTLEIGIEGDVNGLQTIDLSSLQDGTGTDDQILDSLGLTGTTLEVGIEGDANGLQTIDLSSLQDGTGTDDQILDSLGLTGTTLEIGIEGAVNGLQTIDLSSLQDGTGTDDQILDSLGLTGNILEIGIEGDVNGLQTLDLTPILGSSENIYNTSDSLEGNRVVTMDGNSLTFDGTGTGDFIIQADGDVGIGTTTPAGDLGVTSDEDQDAFNFTQATGTTGEKDVLTIEDQDIGDGTQDESSVLKVVKSGAINSADNGFSLVELANTGADPGASKYWISGRKTDEGAPLWGVDITDNDFWSEGGIILGVSGADGGTYSGGNFIVEPDGDVGIGTITPGARLEVDGGSVIFDEYGIGTYNDTSANYILAADTSGAVVELNTAANTRWFYAPAVTVDASDTISNATIDLHQEYIDQFTSIPAAQRSTGAPDNIPVYAENELWYFVTFYDNTVIDNISISAAGVLTYDIISVPFDNYTIVNIAFLIK